jgi:nucleotidyltransferase substrate binding protein (TIGR01987 family)
MSESSEDSKQLDLESFERVTMRLGEAIRDHKSQPENLYILDSVIKRFELTYELATRSLRRFLIDYALSSTEVNDMSFAGIIRRGDKEGLLKTGWPRWQDFREARNETVHTYREEKAREIAA